MRTLPLLLLLLLPLSSQAQLLSPAEYLGDYPAQFTPHHRVLDYFKYVADNSPRVELVQYGLTNEGRPLMLAFVSTPENLKNRENIRQNHLKRAGVLQGEPDSDFSPAITWLSFGVHGNEAGATESSMRVLWNLANGKMDKYLQNNLIIIDPAINPDGFARYVNWYRSVSGIFSVPEREAREHHEPWPGGRVNHYYFDLNRDWAWATQAESRQRLLAYNHWLPHIHVDFHEQYPDNPYYFAPAAQPFHDYITAWQAEFQTTIGRNNSRAFDQQGWLYFTREIFDLLYPSYGDTYPIFNGAIGMTYEQAGHAISGRAILMENGDTLTLADRIAHHTATALRTIQTASQNAAELESHFAEHFRKTAQNPPGEYRSYLISYENGRDKLQSLIRLLDLHGIRYGALGQSRTLSGFDYRTGQNLSRKADARDLVIPVNQPKATLIQVLFEPETHVPDSLTYDITAWSLPFARGLQALALKTEIQPASPFVLDSPVWQQPRDEEAYVYVFPWKSYRDARFLGALLQAGLVVRYAQKPFTLQGHAFDRGTLILTRADNRKKHDFHRSVQRIAREQERDFYAFTGGFSDFGPDMGSESMHFIKAPRMLLLGGSSVDANAFGHCWYYFDQVLHYPVTVMETNKIGRLPLDKYDVLILPSGKYKPGEEELKKLQQWIAKGGRVILLGQSVASLAGKGPFQIKRKPKPQGPKSPELTFAERERSSIAASMPGAIISVRIDQTHPLAFGLPQPYHLLKFTPDTYEYLELGWNVGTTAASTRHYGFVGSKLEDQLNNALYFGEQNLGKGKIVYLPDTPLFRAFWEQGFLLMANAVFF